MDTHLYSVGAYFVGLDPELADDVVAQAAAIEQAGLERYAEREAIELEAAFQTLVTGLAVRYYRAVNGLPGLSLDAPMIRVRRRGDRYIRAELDWCPRRGVAQPGSARRSGRRGPRFKSGHADVLSKWSPRADGHTLARCSGFPRA